MTDLLREHKADQDEYQALCTRYGERPVFSQNSVDIDPYSKHAVGLRARRLKEWTDGREDLREVNARRRLLNWTGLWTTWCDLFKNGPMSELELKFIDALPTTLLEDLIALRTKPAEPAKVRVHDNGPEQPDYSRGGDGPNSPLCPVCKKHHWNTCPT